MNRLNKIDIILSAIKKIYNVENNEDAIEKFSIVMVFLFIGLFVSCKYKKSVNILLENDLMEVVEVEHETIE